MSQLLMKILVLEFTLIAVVAAWEKNWSLAGYGVGAAILNASIMWGI